MKDDDTQFIIMDEIIAPLYNVRPSNNYRIRVERSSGGHYKYTIQRCRFLLFWWIADPSIDIKLVSYDQGEAILEYTKILDHEIELKKFKKQRRDRQGWRFVRILK